jgi:hypothetical protein
MTFSIEIVKEGFMNKKYAFPGRTTFYFLPFALKPFNMKRFP